ncbi:type 4a pilus biogenesis protein PilO [Patescibacteria group bacterium]|nr:type 4a pilus biogenesis protein PilO [Patescibacteria group bacterium]
MKKTIPLSKNLIVSQTKPLIEFLKKQRENKKFNQTIEITATFFLISFFLFSAIRPALTTISGLVGEIHAKQSLSGKMRSKINDLVLAQDTFSAVQEKYILIESSLPSVPKFAQASTQLKNITYDSGINLNEIKFGLNNKTDKSDPDSDMTAFYSIQINDDTTNFTKIPSLVQDLSENRRIMKINRIELSQTKSKELDQQEDGTQFNANMDIYIYYWLEK